MGRRRTVRRIEKGDEIAIGQPEENVHIRMGFSRARLFFKGKRCCNWQPEHILIEAACLLGIAAAKRRMVNALQRAGRCSVRHHSLPNSRQSSILATRINARNRQAEAGVQGFTAVPI